VPKVENSMSRKRYKHIEPKEPDKSGRREFLSKIWKLLGLLALGELTIFSAGMLRPGRKDKKNSSSLLKTIGSVEDFPKNSVTPDRINKFFLIRADDGGFLALSLTCSHLGCSVIWDQVKNQFLCPCHSSAFDKFGSVINSPAPRPLDYFPLTVEAGKVKIDLNQKTKRKKFEKNQVTYAI
jgi:cytochrome b6-f complex iron-sulfur subunit